MGALVAGTVSTSRANTLENAIPECENFFSSYVRIFICTYRGQTITPIPDRIESIATTASCSLYNVKDVKNPRFSTTASSLCASPVTLRFRIQLGDEFVQRIIQQSTGPWHALCE
uniref:Uncharacterized protein n=1 Tax=Ditylenchus dipsaci TaxID=166011 RepID=A0A915E2U4_9BILA